MKDSTSKILIYAVVFLGILSLATFSTIGYHIYSSKKSEEGTITNAGNSQKYSGRYFRDRLNLSADQMDKFRGINGDFRNHARDINLKLIDQRKNMMGEMQKVSPDTITLNNLSDSIGQLHAQLKKYTYKYYQGIKGICTADQVTELDKIFDEFFINDMHFNQQRGQGNRGQHRYGQQRNRQ